MIIIAFILATILASTRPAGPASAGGPWVLAAQPAPLLRAPTPGTALETIGPVNFVFDAPPGSVQYHLQVTPIGGDGPGVDLIRDADAPFTLPAPRLGAGPYVLLPAMTYTWRVRAAEAAQGAAPVWGDWSFEWFFTTPPPSARSIRLVEPLPGATAPTLVPTLAWAADDPSLFYYEVQLSTDPRFTTDPSTAIASVYTNLVHGGESRPLNSWTVPSTHPLDPGWRYYWRVRPRVQGNGTPVDWPEASWFESSANPVPATPTPTAAPAPVATATPAPSATATTTPTPTPTPTPTGGPAQGTVLQWQLQRSGTTESLSGLDAVDANVAWAVGNSDTILRTIDRGQTWEPRPSITARGVIKHNWYGVAAMDKDNAWVVGEEGAILRTSDGGATWREEDSQTEVNLNAATMVDRSTAWAIGSGGIIRKSSGGGSPWTPVTAGAGQGLNDISVVSPQVLFLSSNNGRVLKTTDGGNSWSVLNVGMDEALIGISASSARDIWAVSPGGMVFRTANGGTAWDDMRAIRRTELTGILAQDNATAWVTGFGGTVLGTNDRGATWVRQTTGTISNLGRIAAAEGSTWVVGSGGVILHARDGSVR